MENMDLIYYQLAQTYTVAEHAEKVGYVLKLLLPVSALMCGFFALGLWASHLYLSKYLTRISNAHARKATSGRGFRQTVDEQNKLGLEVVRAFDKLVKKLQRREQHVIQLHRRLAQASTKDEDEDLLNSINLDDLDGTHLEIVGEVDDRDVQIEDLSQQVRTLQQANDRAKREIEALQSQTPEIELDDEQPTIEFSLASLELSEENENLRLQVESKNKEIANLHKRYALLQKKVLNLEEAAAKHAPEVEENKIVPISAFSGENVKTHHQFGVIYTDQPAQVDDLKKIKGVGKVLEKALNKFGVYRFKQIALWEQTVIDEFAAILPFGERVIRDRWTDQSRDLHEHKYGEKVS